MSDNLAPAVLLKRALAAERERDAYKRAKNENDERFMLERDEARRERDEARAEAACLRALLPSTGPTWGEHCAGLGEE
jgi:hypothetical protein